MAKSVKKSSVKKASVKPKKPAAKKPAAKPKKAAAKKPKVDIEARLASIPAEKAVEPPSHPVVFASADAAKLFRIGKPVRAALAKLGGFDLRYLDELPAYRDELEDAEAAWNKARARGNEGSGPRTIEQAESLKSDLMASGRYLLRHDPVVQQRLDQIAEGSGLLDLAEDLRELAHLAEEFPSVFAADASLPRAAAARARDFADKIVANLTGPTSTEALTHRNRAFWLVAQANSELRAALRFLWRKQPAKLAELGVSYSRGNAKKRPDPEPKPAG